MPALLSHRGIPCALRQVARMEGQKASLEAEARAAGEEAAEAEARADAAHAAARTAQGDAQAAITQARPAPCPPRRHPSPAHRPIHTLQFRGLGV